MAAPNYSFDKLFDDESINTNVFNTNHITQEVNRGNNTEIAEKILQSDTLSHEIEQSTDLSPIPGDLCNDMMTTHNSLFQATEKSTNTRAVVEKMNEMLFARMPELKEYIKRNIDKDGLRRDQQLLHGIDAIDTTPTNTNHVGSNVLPRKERKLSLSLNFDIDSVFTTEEEKRRGSIALAKLISDKIFTEKNIAVVQNLRSRLELQPVKGISCVDNSGGTPSSITGDLERNASAKGGRNLSLALNFDIDSLFTTEEEKRRASIAFAKLASEEEDIDSDNEDGEQIMQHYTKPSCVVDSKGTQSSTTGDLERYASSKKERNSSLSLNFDIDSFFTSNEKNRRASIALAKLLSQGLDNINDTTVAQALQPQPVEQISHVDNTTDSPSLITDDLKGCASAKAGRNLSLALNFDIYSLFTTEEEKRRASIALEKLVSEEEEEEEEEETEEELDICGNANDTKRTLRRNIETPRLQQFSRDAKTTDSPMISTSNSDYNLMTTYNNLFEANAKSNSTRAQIEKMKSTEFACVPQLKECMKRKVVKCSQTQKHKLDRRNQYHPFKL